MENPEPDRKDDPNSSLETTEKKPPPLEAIIPDESNSSSEALITDLDDYQKKLDREWESAKISYHQKIDNIMKDFMKQSLLEPPPIEPSSSPKPSERHPSPPAQESGLLAESTDAAQRLERLLARAEKTLRIKHEDKKPLLLDLPSSYKNQKTLVKRVFVLLFFSLLAISLTSGALYFLGRPTIQSLPYPHTSGPVVTNENIYIVDWFRKSLYVHSKKWGTPLISVENIPNMFVKGFAVSEKGLWTLDGFNGKIFFHAATPDHQVLKEFESPSKKPTGLAYDGNSFWTADEDNKTLYRLKGTDVEEILDQFNFPDVTPSALQVMANRVWVLDGKSRELMIYRLQQTLKRLMVVDLDPYLKGATPTGFFVDGSKIWIVTENPPQLIQIPIRKINLPKQFEI